MRRRVGAAFFKCHFELGKKGGGCGQAALNTILMLMEKRGIIFSFSPEKGITSARIMYELRRVGLKATPKTITTRSLKPYSILWYPPPRDHYVAVGIIRKGKALIYDSEKSRAYWMPLQHLAKRWYKQYSGRQCGWVIEVRKK